MPSSPGQGAKFVRIKIMLALGDAVQTCGRVLRIGKWIGEPPPSRPLPLSPDRAGDCGEHTPRTGESANWTSLLEYAAPKAHRRHAEKADIDRRQSAYGRIVLYAHSTAVASSSP